MFPLQQSLTMAELAIVKDLIDSSFIMHRKFVSFKSYQPLQADHANSRGRLTKPSLCIPCKVQKKSLPYHQIRMFLVHLVINGDACNLIPADVFAIAQSTIRYTKLEVIIQPATHFIRQQEQAEPACGKSCQRDGAPSLDRRQASSPVGWDRPVLCLRDLGGTRMRSSSGENHPHQRCL